MENPGKINFPGNPGKVMENLQKVESHGKKISLKVVRKFCQKMFFKIILLF